MKHHNLGILAVLALLATPLGGCNTGQATVPAAEDEGSPLPVAVVAPRIADIQASYLTTASIEAEADARIPARAAGDVVEILVEEGDAIVKGQVLARLDGDRARLEAQRAKAEFEKNTREYERLTNLHARGLISSAAYQALEYDVKASKAAYDLAALDYEYTNIRATIDGVVSAREIKIGANVVEGQTTFVITETDKLVAYLDIPQTELAKFAAGQTAAMTVDSDPQSSFTALVERISPTIDVDTGTFRATMAIDNTEGRLAPGMFGRFTIAYETHSDALVIPNSAAVREDSEVVVYVVTDGKVSRRRVGTGIEADGLVEIVSGLSTGDSVVLSGQARLREGSRVLASAAPGAPRATG
jgi:membrane fusion protein (multidrug efflux system)